MQCPKCKQNITPNIIANDTAKKAAVGAGAAALGLGAAKTAAIIAGGPVAWGFAALVGAGAAIARSGDVPKVLKECPKCKHKW